MYYPPAARGDNTAETLITILEDNDSDIRKEGIIALSKIIQREKQAGK